MAQHQRRIDRVLGPDYLDGLDGRSIDEVRQMDRECVEIETELSYVRRLAQGRIDIIDAEVDRRGAGGSLGDLIAALPKILSDDSPRPDPAATRFSDPTTPASEIEFKRGLESLISDGDAREPPHPLRRRAADHARAAPVARARGVLQPQRAPRGHGHARP